MTSSPQLDHHDLRAVLRARLDSSPNGLATVLVHPDAPDESYSIADVLRRADAFAHQYDELPADAEDPIVIEINFSNIPIMIVNVSGDYGLVRLKEIGEDLADEIETIPGILEVNLSGGLEREVQVDVDLNKLLGYGLSFSDIADAIRKENANIPGGSIDIAISSGGCQNVPQTSLVSLICLSDLVSAEFLTSIHSGTCFLPSCFQEPAPPPQSQS